MSSYGSYQDALLQHNANIANPDFHSQHLVGRTDIADHTTAKAVLVDTDGHLKVDVVSSVGGGGDASLTEQQTQTGHLSSVDGKITSCNTGAVVVSSSALPTGASTETTLSALNTKMTACNTGAVVISTCALPTGASSETTLSALNTKVSSCDTGAVVVSSSALPTGAATESSLASVDGKITACNTGAVVVSSSALPTGAATESSLSTMNGKITACDTSALSTSANQVNIINDLSDISTYTGDTLTAVQDVEASLTSMENKQDAQIVWANTIHTDMATTSQFPTALSNGFLKVSVQESSVQNAGSQGNLVNGGTLSYGGTSNSVDISQMNTSSILYEDTQTASSDEVGIEVSLNNSTFYELGTIYPSLNNAGTKRLGNYTGLSLHGMLYLRLKNKSSTLDNTMCSASVAGSA